LIIGATGLIRRRPFFVLIVAWFTILFTGRTPRVACSASSSGHPLEHPGNHLRAHPGH
jgi:hypothetical protein